jgi:hypothetical protein
MKTMNIKSKVVSIIGAGLILVGSVTGAVAQETLGASAPVSVTVEVDRGGIGIESVQQSTAFNTVKVEHDFKTASSTEGAVSFKVRDARFTRVGWSVNISATDFKSGDEIVPVNNLSVTNITVTKEAGDDGPVATDTPFAMALGSSPTVVGAAEGTGSGLYQVEVGTKLTIPANTTIGTYTSTITFNLAAAP